MTQVDLIWRLEEHFTLLKEYRKNLDILKKDVSLKNLVNEHKQISENRLSLITSLENKRKVLLSKEKNFRDTSFLYKEMESSLYNGSISDFKQLEHLNHERESIGSLLKSLENEIIELMVDIDDLLKRISLMDVDICNLKSKISEMKEMRLHKSSELIKGINEENKIIAEYSIKLPKDLLEKYLNIRTKKKHGVVKIVENICTGCNMVISSFDFEKVKIDNEIVYCEHCGRILYYQSVK